MTTVSPILLYICAVLGYYAAY